MGELAEAGCVAFSQSEAALADTQVLLRAMQYASTFGYRVWLRPQDPHLGKGGVAHDGEVATRLGLAAIPASAETIALATIFALVRETGASVHVCRLSTADGVAMVAAAKKGGLAVTPHRAEHTQAALQPAAGRGLVRRSDPDSAAFYARMRRTFSSATSGFAIATPARNPA